jgi:hypothetical protein
VSERTDVAMAVQTPANAAWPLGNEATSWRTWKNIVSGSIQFTVGNRVRSRRHNVSNQRGASLNNRVADELARVDEEGGDAQGPLSAAKRQRCGAKNDPVASALDLCAWLHRKNGKFSEYHWTRVVVLECESVRMLRNHRKAAQWPS